MKNAVYVISPYRKYGVWVFDDERFGLQAEPFVGATNNVIDHLLTHNDIQGPFSLQFSRHKLPEFDTVFSLKEIVQTSAWYTTEWGIPFWLCPVLNHYFESIPKKIYVKILKTKKIQRTSPADRCQA